MKNLIWGLLIAAFIADVLIVKFFPPQKILPTSQDENNIPDTQIPSHYDNIGTDYPTHQRSHPVSDGSLPERPTDSDDFYRIQVRHCSSLKQKYEDLRKEIIGNYTNIDLIGFEYPAPPQKQMIAKVLGYVQMGFIAYLILGTYIRPHLTFIPPFILDFLDKYKFALGIFNYFFMSKYITSLQETGAFEVMIRDVNVI
jgi:hypothetical protein